MSVSGPGPTHAVGRIARPAANATTEQKLRGTAQQLQGVFVEQLFKAMRDTVPQDGVFSGGQGEEMFRGLLDQHMSEIVPTHWTGVHSLGETIVRQLSQRASQSPAAPASAEEK
jgi:flagellar protein FlgJ